MNKFQRFFTIKKIDDEQQMVYGYASTNDLDSDGEVIKLSALEKALPGYMQFPTIREMHQPNAVGKTKESKVDGKGLYIGCKIVAKDAWEKVKEGVYPAFSIGGNIVKKVGNVIQELELIEISLVDVPANKHAVVELWKAGKTTKSAETVYSLTNLMIQVKDMIYYYEYQGKDTKKLNKILEALKAMIGEAAAEPEPETGKMKKEFLANFSKMILEIDFGENEVATKLAKEVSKNMKKEEKKVEDPKKDPAEETPTGDTETPETPEQPETPEEKGEDAPTLQKLQEIQGNLEKIVADRAEVDKGVVNTLSKMQEALTSLAEKVDGIAKSAKPAKSKSAIVHKSTEDAPKDTDVTKTDRKAEIEKRLKELNKLVDDIGRHNFAKQGFSLEAGRLQVELESIVRNEAKA